MALTKTRGFGNKLFKDEYQNWLALGYGFDLMNEVIRPYITQEMRALYDNLIHGAFPPCVCRYDKSRRNNHWHDMTTCAWAKTFQGYHLANKPKWNQSDPSKWTDPRFGYWEIAKLFMSDLGKQKTVVVEAWSTDTTGLLNILCWCTIFAPLRPFAEQVRDARNIKWGHNPTLELSLADKNNAILTIERLLSAGALSTDPNAKNTLQQIQTINKHFDAQKLERKILRDFIDECSVYKRESTNDLNGLQMRMEDVEVSRGKDNKEIKRLKKRIELFDKSLKTLSQRLNNMETNWPRYYLYGIVSVVVLLSESTKQHSKSFLMAIVIMLLAVQLDPKSDSLERCPTEDRPLSFNSREFNFSMQLYAGKEHFVGRRWLYEDVKSTMSSLDAPILLIIGEPGSGKSAIATNLICSRNSVPSIHANIIGYHLCQHYNKETRETGRFIRNLVDMVARRIPEYEKVILNGSLIDVLQRHNCESDPHKCFGEVLITPLKKLLTDRLDNQNRIYYIVVDALDECISEQGRPVITIIDLLRDKAAELPKQVKIIATTRNESNVVRVLSVANMANVIFINTSDSRNLEDISFYIDTNIYPRLSFVDKIKAYLSVSLVNSFADAKVSEDLVKVSQGNFLFVKLLVRYVKSEGQTSSVMPNTLGQVYEIYFRRVFPTRDSFRYIQGVLEILVSTFKPFKVKDVFKTLQLDKSDLEYRFFHQDLDSLSQFLRYTEDNKISLFHKSLLEWLVSDENKSNYIVSKKAGHKKLALYYMNLISNNQTSDLPDAVFNLAQHIALGDLLDKYSKVFHRITSHIIKGYRNDKDNSTFLHLASAIENPKVLKLFLQLPLFLLDIDCKDARGFTAAFISASRGILDNVKVLVSHGANVNHKTNLPPPLPFLNLEEPVVVAKREFWNSTMLHAAAYAGHLEIVKFLLENNATVANRNGVGMTAIQLGSENGHLAIVELLYQHGAEADQLALYHAAMNGHKDVAEFFVKKNVADECMRCDGSFYWLNEKNRYQSLWLISPSFEDIPDYILRMMDKTYLNTAAYILVDDRSFLYCETPLHVAVSGGHVETARLLISVNNLSIFCTDSKGRSPLHVAARKNNLEIMKLLIDAGARVNSKCLQFQQIQRLKHNSSVFYIKKYEHLSLKEEGEYFAETCSCGFTPVHVAAQFGHVDAAQMLIQQNGQLATKSDCHGNSLIHIAACYGQHHFIQWLVKNFREIEIDSQNKNGSTPLHNSVACGNYKEVKQLIADKANLFAVDKNNMTVLHHAVLNLQSYYGKENIHISETNGENRYFTVIIYKDFDQRQTYYEHVPIDRDCHNVIELLSYYNDLEHINGRDAFGRTPLVTAIRNGLHCVSIALMKNIPLQQFDIKLGNVNETWNDLLDDFNAKDEKHQWEVLDIIRMLLFYTHSEQQNNLGTTAKSLFVRSIFLSYLKRRKRLRTVETWLLDLKFTVTINCQMSFMESELHLLSYWPPASHFHNFFFKSVENHPGRQCRYEPGRLYEAIKRHPLRRKVINQCRDLEGYTPLHRAAQGGNIIGIEQLLSWGADTTATTSNSNQTALDLAVSYAGLPKSFHEASFIDLHQLECTNDVATYKDIPSMTAIMLLYKTPDVKVICDGSSTQLTIYHIAAYRGMFKFVRELLKNSKRFGIEVDCPDVNGVTPLYLAKLSVGWLTHFVEGEARDSWDTTVRLIESYGGKLNYPVSLEAEYHVLYRHLYGSVPLDLKTDMLNVLNDILLLYNHDPISICSKKSGVVYDYSSYRNCSLHLLKMLMSSSSVDAYAFVELLVLTEKMERKSNDFSVGSLGLLIKNFDNMDDIWGVLERISKTMVSDNSAEMDALKERVHKCSVEVKLCSRFNQSLITAILDLTGQILNNLQIDSLSLSRTILRRLEFMKSRFAVFPVLSILLSLDSSLNHDLITLAEGARYFLEIVLNKKTKYDYLQTLTLGISPTTRLFYDNVKVTRNSSQIHAAPIMAKLMRIADGFRMSVTKILDEIASAAKREQRSKQTSS